MREQETINKREAERKAELNKLLQHLATRAKLAENDKSKLFQDLNQKDKELEAAKEELKRLQQNVAEAEELEDIPKRVIRYTQSSVLPRLILEKINISSPEEIRAFIKNHKTDFSKGYLHDLMRYGLINNDYELTTKGSALINELLSV